jgi:hypothetical protein
VIVLDTNVVSELMQPAAAPAVVSWLDAVDPESVWTTTITVFEVWFGLELLVTGRRRKRLEQLFAAMLQEDLDGRVLPFDDDSARTAASLAAVRRRAGRPVEVRDVQIAGIVAARGATLATRNTRDFEQLGLTLVDPWSV